MYKLECFNKVTGERGNLGHYADLWAVWETTHFEIEFDEDDKPGDWAFQMTNEDKEIVCSGKTLYDFCAELQLM